MTVYLLIVMLNPGVTGAMAYAVPDIASAEQCDALGRAAQQDKRTNFDVRYRCVAYKKAA